MRLRNALPASCQIRCSDKFLNNTPKEERFSVMQLRVTVRLSCQGLCFIEYKKAGHVGCFLA